MGMQVRVLVQVHFLGLPDVRVGFGRQYSATVSGRVKRHRLFSFKFVFIRDDHSSCSGIRLSGGDDGGDLNTKAGGDDDERG